MGVDEGGEEYALSDSVWTAIGEGCHNSGNTIPSAFGARIPNIATTERYYFKAETWLLFATVVGPVLLHNRFRKRDGFNLAIQYESKVDLLFQKLEARGLVQV